MPQKIVWTEAADGTLLHLRRNGTTWDAVAAALGVSRNAAIDRAKRLVLAGGAPAAATERVARPVVRPARPTPPPPAPDRPPAVAGPSHVLAPADRWHLP